mmetsp:Transcript_25109/g.22153  ORF Transcript_25109/g.22153 Transcript_25109/m.22153 type:complete len:169 (+) Transcript_25109:1135-1641(+)|eukprot:CAMPEP_0114575482 /NCGR_PEP_ID=MMETSP0125-20121206/346_1 /TAXON_ID=485358 ORGANISM="Aristerostoma sp., Strain ATCC 50986" /NCGR_SAMPLE_ID=MMETSP0125 /ASSEMBLY_ACC=CAM_ASM_000245 /LENGTH=168 /DNA_ID=CAMNT_0001763245 /DNA_START=145 /DNA_END=651 /DNA_ORIENTATION=-
MKGLDIRNEIFGPEHVDTASSYNALGSLFCDTENYKKALEYHEKALAIRIPKVGAEHMLVGRSYYNMSTPYMKLNQIDKAKECILKCIQIREKIYGKSNPDYGAAVLKYAEISINEGDIMEADKYLEEAIEVKNKLKKPDEAFNNDINFVSALIYLERSKFDEALKSI